MYSALGGSVSSRCLFAFTPGTVSNLLSSTDASINSCSLNVSLRWLANSTLNSLGKGWCSEIVYLVRNAGHSWLLDQSSNVSCTTIEDKSTSLNSSKRVAPASLRSLSMSLGMRWNVAAQSRFPHPKTANETPDKMGFLIASATKRTSPRWPLVFPHNWLLG